MKAEDDQSDDPETNTLTNKGEGEEILLNGSLKLKINLTKNRSLRQHQHD